MTTFDLGKTGNERLPHSFGIRELTLGRTEKWIKDNMYTCKPMAVSFQYVPLPAQIICIYYLPLLLEPRIITR